jgi:transposase
MSDSKNFEVITAPPERLAVSPGRSYRTWSREAKERIVKETFLPGANVSAN